MADRYVDFAIRIKDNGSETLKKISVSAADLTKGIRSVQQETGRLNAEVVNMTQLAQAFEGIGAVVGQLNSVFSDLSASYRTQLVAETQLQTVMEQRMNATQKDIESIKELCSAQQQLGVIGDEVALSGAQQMATFLNNKDSLDALIPAMNNLLAQQKGLNATTQDAVSIGNMMGKAMQGSVDVLQRVGVTFSEAQKNVLTYGNESERAAMLAEVIRDNVGEMNAALAATDPGRQKQLENTLGDIKEQFGGIVQKAMPVLTVAANLSMAATGAMRFYASVKAVAAALNAKRAALLAADVATKRLTLSTVALQSAYTLGASVAIYAVVKLFQRLTDSVSDTSEAQDGLKESTDAYTSTVSATKAAIDLEVSSLAKLIKEKGNDANMVSTLNSKYGESLGYHQSAAEWYDVLISKSADYCRALGYEAQAKVVASQKAAKELELEALRKRKSELETAGNAYKKNSGSVVNALAPQYAGRPAENKTDEYRKIEKDIAIAESAVSQLGETFEACMTKVQESASALSITTTELNAQQQSYDQLSKSIDANDKTLKSLAPDQVAEIARLKKKNIELKQQREELGKIIGVNSTKNTDEKLGVNFDVHYTEVDKILNPDGVIQKLKRDGIIVPVEFDVEDAPDEVELKKSDVAPLPLEKLSTLNDLQDAISYYQQLQRTQSAAEIIETQRTIDKLSEKKNAMQQLTAIPAMQQESQRLDGMSDAELKMELKLIGLGEVQAKIRDLQKMLSDTKNPLGDEQRKDVEGLVDSYSSYERVLKKSNISMRSTWGSVSGIAGGIESISAALDSNASAWRKASVVIDSGIQVYDGLKSVTEIIQLLTSLSAAHAATKVVEAGAETTAATATAASGATAVTTSAIVSTALGLETAQWSALAAAKTFAAHAEIPFAGTPIAAGFVAMQQAAIAAAAIPKFANGCIAYGPTLGIFGEYAGAANNPEVVAPLDKLKTIIGVTGGGPSGKVEFKLRGRNLVGAIAREGKVRNRT